MATVPGDPNPPAGVPSLPKEFEPSIGHFLQAAAIMDGMGRFKVAGDVVSMPGAATPGERVSKALSTDDLNKLSTKRTLSRALGGGAKVLPIKPEGD